MEGDTIAAIATPLGSGGIGVVRISGPEAVAVAGRVFVRTHGLPGQRLESHRMYHGFVIDAHGRRVDEALLCIMRQPHSYTCEDVVEVSCHGGLFITQRVLETVLAQGVRVAEPGEFTKRAFLNGRLDLAQAEAVIDLINARTETSYRTALDQLEGALSRRLRGICEELLQVSMYLEAGIDFPEEELELASLDHLATKLQQAAQQLQGLLQTFQRGQAIRDGVATAIVGCPNVGKSSLLNAFLGRERAIVSPQPGTTRDTLEETIEIGGILLRIIDTAGIRATVDPIESEGVRRTQQVIERAALLLLMFDNSAPLRADDWQLLEATRHKPRILIRNKCDLQTAWSTHDMTALQSFASCVHLSILHEKGLDELERSITQHVLGSETFSQEEVLLTRSRHQQSVVAALAHVQAAEQSLRQGIPWECVALDVTEALQYLGEVLGEKYSGELLDRIFSHFCIGK